MSHLNLKKKKKSIIFFVISLLYFSSIFSNAFINIGTSDLFLETQENIFENNDDLIELKVNISEIMIENINFPSGEKFQRLSIEGGGNLGQTGSPSLPFKTVKILLPYGKDIADIEIITGKIQILEGSYKIEPTQEQIPISSDEITEFKFDYSIYNSDNPFPDKQYSIVGTYELRGYRILVLNLHPVSYIPKTGKVSYFKDMTVLVRLTNRPNANLLFRNLKVDEKRVVNTVDNPELVDVYRGKKNQLISLGAHLDLPPESYDYVIITNEALLNSAGTYTFQDLKDSKDAAGIQTTIITTEYIYANYPGADNPEKIRNFIIDAYQTWGIEYVLLGGDGDEVDIGGESGDSIIPSRGFYATVSSYVDYNITSDLYYAGLDGNWNTNGNDKWAEPGEDDLYAEVYVGRAPVDSEVELSNFVYKTLAHEIETHSYLLDVLMVGEDLGWVSWGGDYKDEVKDGSNANGYTTEGFPSEYFVNTLYDRELDPARWDKNDLMPLINDGIHIINHLGHCNVEYSMKMENYDADALTNDHYFFGYSQGCYNGAFDNRGINGAIHENDSIVEHFVTTPHGAFAFVANSRYGWGVTSGTNGASQHYDREFFDAIFAESIEEIGRANQDSKEDNIGFISQVAMRWVYYELNLMGDPIATFRDLDHELKVSLEYPAHCEIDNTYTINATVINNGENDEINVDLFLYLDDVPVDSIPISSLPVGASETINYIWTPTEYKTYNFTAYAPPVPGEIFTSNNILTKLMHIVDSNLFNGMYIAHDLTDLGFGTWPSNVLYTYNTGEIFDVAWDFTVNGDNWQVNSTTREITGSYFFADFTHTPMWIFTDISIGDTVLISSIWDVDHTFEVQGELIYDLPGFGLIEIWVLQDLGDPSATALYEKSTGILLNGTFYYAGGNNYVIFEFVDTNVEFTYLVPPGDFILSSNAGTPDKDGAFDLTWTSAEAALNYSVYEYSSYITEINGSLTLLIAGTEDLSLSLSGYSDGTYYFIVVANNTYGGTLSNCIEVVVEIGPPGDFILSSNAGTPDDNGAFDLTWTSAEAALNYSVYEYSSYITKINGSLTSLINETEDLILSLSGYSDGTYYFIVVANNTYGGTLSNCYEVVVQIPQPTPPGSFVLSSNAGTPDNNGAFDLTWTSAAGAVSYSVYEYSSYITEINESLTLLGDGITNLSLALSGYTNGTYYFIAVAYNAIGNTLSNCIEVVVQIPPDPDPDPDPTPPFISGYNIFIFVPIILVVVMVIIRKQHKKRSQY